MACVSACSPLLQDRNAWQRAWQMKSCSLPLQPEQRKEGGGAEEGDKLFQPASPVTRLPSNSKPALLPL